MEGTPAELAELAKRLTQSLTQSGSPTQSQPGTGPAMYRNIPDPNNLMTMLQPIVTTMLNIQNAQRIPQVRGGQSVSDAFYGQQVVTQQWERVTQQAVGEFARAVGNAAGQINQHLGISQSMGMSASQFSRQAAEIANSAGGRMGVQMMLGTQQAQAVMGGNPLEAYQRIFAGRQASGVRGQMVDPFNMYQSEMLASNAAMVGSQLTQRAYRGANGQMGITPDFGFTRGFKVEDIADWTMQAQQRGRDITNAFRTPGPVNRMGGQDSVGIAQVGQLTSTMEHLGGLMGTDNSQQLMGALNKLTNNQWATMDWQKLNQRFAEMAATANLLGVSGQKMIETVDTMQSAMQGAVGITPMHVAMGRSGGGFGSIENAMDMTSRVLQISAQTGRRGPEQVAQITAEQVGLRAMGYTSTVGRQSRMIEYLNQQGQIAPQLYEQYHASLTKSPAERELVANKVFERAITVGGAAEGRRLMFNDPYMNMITHNTSTETAGKINRSLDTAQANEVGYRISEAINAQQMRHFGGIRQRNGQQYMLSPSERGQMYLTEATGELNEQANLAAKDGDPTRAGQLRSAAELMRTTYDERFPNRLSNMPLIAEYKDKIAQRMQAAEPAALAAKYNASRLSANAQVSSAIRAFTQMPGVDTSWLAQAQNLQNTDPEKALAMVQAHMQALSPVQRSVVQGGMDRSAAGASADYETAQANAGARDLMDRGRAASMSGGLPGAINSLVAADLSNLSGALEGGKADEIAAAREKLTGTLGTDTAGKLFSADKLKELRGAAANGGLDKIRGLTKERASIKTAFERSYTDAEAGTAGTVGLFDAIDQRTASFEFKTPSGENAEETVAREALHNQWLNNYKQSTRRTPVQTAMAAAEGTAALSEFFGLKGPMTDEQLIDTGDKLISYGMKSGSLSDKQAKAMIERGDTLHSGKSSRREKEVALREAGKDIEDAHGKKTKQDKADGKQQLQLKGTLQMLDSRGRPSGTVQIDAFGEQQ